MLDYVHDNDLDHIVSWDTSGQGFTVYNVPYFVETILPRYVAAPFALLHDQGTGP